ncbi:MAG TPA: response regulator transcription factor [Nitrospiraceae bacterium]|nr:response regulator transcription factor [Nitrospiraceae bacterium]
MTPKILIVEDEQGIVHLLKARLEPEGFQVIAAYNGQEGLRAVTEARPDLVILDLTLPGLDGFELCRRIRRQPETARLPIIVLSGRTEEVDKVVMLELGADDYVTKPFNAKELVARVKTLLRRVSTPAPPRVLRVGTLEMDLDRYTVFVAGEPTALTAKEFELLKALLEAKERTLTRAFLLEQVWEYGEELEIETRTVDVHVRSLRKKLGSEGARILTVRNVGYRLETTSPHVTLATQDEVPRD